MPNGGPGPMAAQLYRRVYLWACERLYHEFAGTYEWVAVAVSLGGWHTRRRTALAHLPQVTSAAPLRVAELGPGPGVLLREMAEAGYAAVGVERSPQMVAVALRGAPTLTPLVQGDARKLPFAAAALDALVATFPAPYILDAATLREAARVLRPGGRLIVTGLWVGSQRWRPLPGRRAPLSAPPALHADWDVFYARVAAAVTAAGLAPQPLLKTVESPALWGVAEAMVGGFVATRTQSTHDDPA